MFDRLLVKYYALTGVELNPGSGGQKIGVDKIATIDYEVVKQAFGAEGELHLAGEDNPLPVTQRNTATSTVTSVDDTNVSVTLLAANTSRIGAMIFNDSTEVLYVKFGAVASPTSFTVKMVAGAYYEVPFGYTGIIDGVWANNASGAARITELSL